MSKPEKENFVYEEVTIDEEDDTAYETVPLENDEDEEDVDLMTVLDSVKKNNPIASKNVTLAALDGVVTQKRPVLLDDFFRNFLIKMELKKSLETFQTEWYEFQSKGKIAVENLAAVPDIYLKNEAIEDENRILKEELGRMKEIADKAKSTWDKLRKERDFHRLHHRRVVQEKNQLIMDMKRLKKHFSTYEPALEALQQKYEVAVKDKTMVRLERDKLAHRLELATMQLEEIKMEDTKPVVQKDKKETTQVKKSREAPWPENHQNPYENAEFEPANINSMLLQKTFKGHSMAISSMALHPRKPIVATVSDDMSWKMWSIPNGELILSGDGHKDWVSDVDFHPQGTSLATCSGDGTVKIWDFMRACCAATFTDHTQSVWGVSYHESGDFVASCSMDHSAKLWDLTSQKCRQSYRGHVDSVNTICFQPYSTNLCTGSGDKTVSLWDMRSGLCVQTFYGHRNAVNSVSFNLQGTNIASCDADGFAKVWDIRMVQEIAQFGSHSHPLNSVRFERSGTMLAAGSDDGTIKLHNLATGDSAGELRGHAGSVQSLLFDPQGKFLLSAGSDNTFRIWS